jgi:Xaa-Pro dipeptidase
MQVRVPLSELNFRLERFRKEMDSANPEWAIAVIFSKINQYYFSGTMQDGMLIIPRNNEAVLWVRRSYERALDESLFPVIKPMDSFRDAAAYVETHSGASHYGRASLPDTVYIETEIVPIALLQRFQKYFPFTNIKPLDLQISAIRAIKSSYELSLMEKSGRIHQHVLEEIVPSMLREGINEADFGSELYTVMVREGHHGMSRFSMFDTQAVLGQIAFGESSIYPTAFNGPGGNYGMHPAIPMIGSRDRKLRHGDLVFVDIGCGVDGYHTDKTLVYMFGASLSDEAISAHNQCVEVQNRVAAMLKPGAIPSEIYNTIMESLSPEFQQNFMGYGNRKVKFLGHGIGLTIDELPVIAQGFDEPLQEGMVFALEPKKGIKDVGLVGIENTFIVTPKGGRCITGTHPGMMKVGF